MSQTTTNSIWIRNAWWQVLTLLLFGFTNSIPVQASNPNDLICVPTTTWYGSSAPNVSQGYNPSDPGWRGAFRYVFGNGTTTPDAIVQGIRDTTNSNLYLAIQVNNLMDWDQYSAVVIAIDPDGTNAHMQLLVISPIQAGVSNTNLNPSGPAEVDFYHGLDPTTGWGSVSSATNPAWPQIYTSYATSGGSQYQWYMAAKLPIDATGNNGLAIPASGAFGFYLNIFAFPNEPPTDPPGSVSAVPFAWPTDAPPIGAVGCSDPQTCLFTQANTLPDHTKWGNVTINPATTCQGVSVSSQTSNIYTNHGTAVYEGVNEPVISRNPGDQNIFYAYVQNTMVDTNGTPVIAQGISGTFKIANFGLPSPESWIVPGTEPGGSPIGGDPTATMNIPSSGSATACASPTNNNLPACTLSTGPWTLNATEQAAYNTPATEHQCVLVQIDSAPGNNTIILNNTAVQNMNFEPESTMMMKKIAEISAKGYALPAHMTDQSFDIGVMTKSEVLKPGPIAARTASSSAATQQNPTSQFTWEAHGCRHTNTFVTIRKKRIEICESVGAFGFVVHNTSATAVQSWTNDLSGPNLKKVKNNVYSIHIPKDGVAQVSTTIQVPQQRKGCGDRNSPAAMLLLLVGVGSLGFMAYKRPRGNKNQ